MGFTRRQFIVGTASAAGTAALPWRKARADAKFTRYDVTSEAGMRMLASYAKGIEAMLKLPSTDPRNWFRNAFIHFMDCPHGNWWFYAWHRGYVGYVEETVRVLSGDLSFAFPYWDWTALPQIPEGMFAGVLTPTHPAYAAFTKDIDTFTAFIQPSVKAYWDNLNPAQRKQLDARGYTSFDLLWNDVTGYDAKTHKVDPGNESFADNARSRYLTATDPKLDDKTAHACSWSVVGPGLEPTQFYSEDITLSFSSSKTPSHTTMPNGATKFSILEGQPHNKVHNYIGGVGPWNPGPYGNMTNFLSPVDPIFFLHHANMDRLWDVWTRKQQELGLPILPAGEDLKTLSSEPFLFFVRADGTFVPDGKAGDYLSTDRFGYTYAAPVAATGGALVASARPAPPLKATLKNGVASVVLPALSAAEGNAPARPVVVAVTLARPPEPSSPREFDVLVNAPADVKSVEADSPYFGGTVAFFGPPMRGMAHDVTFAVPLHPNVKALGSTRNASSPLKLEIRLVPRASKNKAVPSIKTAPDLKAMSVRRL